jgi:uncharacterized repeat protein (TIGR03803 family)
LIHNFTGGADGYQPQGGIVLAPDGSLYGTTYGGGTYDSGTIFQLTPPDSSWTYSVVFSVGGPNGSGAFRTLVGGIVADQSGALYITPEFGGNGKGGGVVQVSPPGAGGGAWTGTAIHSFNGHSPSAQNSPNGPLVYTPDGTLYGTVWGNGSTQVYMLTPPAEPGGHWGGGSPFTFTPEMGYGVYGGLTASGGALYGAAFYSIPSASSPCGSVDQIVPPAGGVGPRKGSAILVFAGAPNDGCSSWATLAAGSDGSLYGVTQYGGTGSSCTSAHPGCGTVFQLTPPALPGGAWTETIIYNFGGVSTGYDGADPMGGVVIAENGKLYGTTQIGGVPCVDLTKVPEGCGTVFELTPPEAPGGPWTERILYRFHGSDGAGPGGPVTLTRTGAAVGTTSSGGTSKSGTIFSIQP